MAIPSYRPFYLDPMTVRSSLELKGIIRAFPVAEVLLEIAQAELSGSLRVEMGEQKAVIYFFNGKAAYAVSNEKKFRLVKALLDQGAIDREYAIQNKNVVSDLQLAEKIEADEKMARDDLKKIISNLCELVVASVLAWPDGEWIFSPYSRLKSEIDYDVNLNNIVMSHARGVAESVAESRIANPNEWFGRSEKPCDENGLRQEEAFILSRFDTVPATLSQIIALIGESSSEPLRIIYTLWLGGYLVRHGWLAAFSEERISFLRSATLELKKPTRPAPGQRKPTTVQPVTEPEAPEQNEADAPFDLDETLSRIESAQNSYQILGISPTSKIDAIRKAYYRLAKMLHPDRYRRESGELLRRVEKAFTELAQAHESIKTPEARANYDIRMRQAESEKAVSESSPEAGAHGDRAAGDFERGFALQLEGEFEAAVPYLARAAYFEPKNARYRAYYGKALSADDDQRHKAEKELATAVQLEPGNTSYRLMLAEFFIKNRLMKRAEGELNRLLEMAPDNKDALRMLDRLRAN